METAWHKKTIFEALEELHSFESGLKNEEALRRLAQYGTNTLPEARRDGLATIFFSQFKSPLIYILLAAALIVLAMGETADGAIIVFVLVFNAVFGTIQEGKSQNTLAALRNFVQTSATVVRNEKILILSDREIVPGDIVLLNQGDKVPADARIIDVDALKVDESSLTGESTPVLKTSEALKRLETSVSERKNIVFKGTNILSGTARAVVVATGMETEIGKISKAIASIDTDMPLKSSIKALSRLIIVTVLLISATLFIVGIARGLPLRVMFATVVSLSVSIIPEGLPIVMTLVLASGVWRMTKQNVLVKKLQAVEALGQANIIAVDKTGTLTKNEMTVEEIWVYGKRFTVMGKGYEPKGEILFEGKAIDPLEHGELLLAGRIALFGSDSHAMYVEDSNMWKVSGDPTEGALKVFALKLGFKDSEQGQKILDLPFDSVTKYHLVVRGSKEENFLSMIGAPEVLLSLCDKMVLGKRSVKLNADTRKEIESVFSGMAEKGLRVVALAMRENVGKVNPDKLPPLTFVGLCGMKDPLREEVAGAVAKAHAAGIRVLMISGDYKITARAIAREAGLLGGDGVLTGEDLKNLSEEELLERIKNCNVFARVTPQDKLRIVELFRKRGDIVAMTGDGVNDAPSLAAADLGVAMGKIGTEVAKEAADLVLLDDNFGSIVAAIEEGRNIYKTIKKVILYLFSTSVGEVLVIAGAIFFGLPLPILPAQIIWLNFVTDGFLDVSLAMEPKEDGLLRDGFRRPSKYILDPFTVKRMIYMGVVIATGSLLMFLWYLGNAPEKALAASLTTLAVFQWFNAWNCKSEKQSVFSSGFFRNKFLIGATGVIVLLQMFALYNPLMQKFLHTTPLALHDWVRIIIVASSILMIEEIRKLFDRKWSLARA